MPQEQLMANESVVIPGAARRFALNRSSRIFLRQYGGILAGLLAVIIIFTSLSSLGGSILGTSRGPQDAVKIVERLCELDINVLFIIGGDGTLRGAGRIASESQRRNHAISIVGIPKTIDNDILFTDKSFGYETACAAAVQATRVAHTEACTVRNGVGMV
jgi:6-phosphofructokinase 1